MRIRRVQELNEEISEREVREEREHDALAHGLAQGVAQGASEAFDRQPSQRDAPEAESTISPALAQKLDPEIRARLSGERVSREELRVWIETLIDKHSFIAVPEDTKRLWSEEVTHRYVNANGAPRFREPEFQAKQETRSPGQARSQAERTQDEVDKAFLRRSAAARRSEEAARVREEKQAAAREAARAAGRERQANERPARAHVETPGQPSPEATMKGTPQPTRERRAAAEQRATEARRRHEEKVTAARQASRAMESQPKQPEAEQARNKGRSQPFHELRKKPPEVQQRAARYVENARAKFAEAFKRELTCLSPRHDETTHVPSVPARPLEKREQALARPIEFAPRHRLLWTTPLGEGRTVDELAAALNAPTANTPSRLEKTIGHLIISLPPGMRADERQAVWMAQRHLTRLGIDLNEHAVQMFEHDDKRHQHFHVLYNRVRLDGGVHHLFGGVSVCHLEAAVQDHLFDGRPSVPPMTAFSKDSLGVTKRLADGTLMAEIRYKGQKPQLIAVTGTEASERLAQLGDCQQYAGGGVVKLKLVDTADKIVPYCAGS